MNPLKKLASQTLTYGVSSIGARAINFLLIRYYTEEFVAKEYGIVTELYAYVAFFMVVYTFGLETGYFRFSNKEEYEERNIYNSTLSFIVVLSVCMTALLILFSGEIANLIELS